MYVQGIRSAREIREVFGIPERTLRRWTHAYRNYGISGLMPGKTGSIQPANSIHSNLEQKIVKLKQKTSIMGCKKAQVPIRLAMSLEDRPQCHKASRFAHQNQTKTTTVKTISEKACSRLVVAGRYLPVPHLRRG
ncbi:helix-turn-helix domain-containing protein [Candidatus Nitrososphaera gargensis]|uniref:helix-turn-helix domain-containing protein n=1 Tax=Candidatus Nitrososphaera gargensis TaxID=497727 RepID=UPI0011E57BD1